MSLTTEIRVGAIIRHPTMCEQEGRMLQHGMNFRCGPDHSVILMSRRKGAPYNDQILNEGRTLIYEGHDVPRTQGVRDPKRLNQPRLTPGGKLTANGKFEKAANEFKESARPAERVRVYEKIRNGIWTYNGLFLLVDAYQVRTGNRQVFKFRLELTDDELPSPVAQEELRELGHNRLIPSAIKFEVFKRDGGKCVKCGVTDNLHFDHDFPFSKGGTSISAKNIRLLCMRHNLEKSNKIE